MTTKEIPTTYDQSKESEIYKLWEESGFFNPDNLPAGKAGLEGEPYTIIMPPSNANGQVHVGHALGFTLQDIMIRFERMRGRKTLWLPGTDHAGFETQVVFEKKLEKEDRSRFGLTREQFYKETWDFVQEYKKLTEDGIRRLGASVDWSRNMFTLDPRIIKIVYTTFEEMYNDGLIYRGNRICNWCIKHQTGLSELETAHEERQDPLYYIKYGPITLATVRPETKFGDTAIAVNPKDARYKKYLGQELEVDGLLGKFKIKVIADELVDKDFGTGAVKVTPAHDALDYEIWQKHKDEISGPKQVIDKRGKMDLPDTKYHGLKIAEARKIVVEDLKALGLMEKIDETYKHNVSLCYKCKNVLEPLIIPQWYVAMTKEIKSGKSLRDLGVEAVKSKKVKINPPRFEKVFMHWMKNIRDWPISRQIWWGIPIPVWYCGEVEKSLVHKIGFHKTIVPELLAGKLRTYRLRDHNLKVGDEFVFEDSGSSTLLGRGVISNVIKTTVGGIELPDMKHSGKYKTTPELIAAFKRMHPEKEVTTNTPAIIYDYSFQPLEKNCGQAIISEAKPTKCPACGGIDLVQDPDTFDTWFSSGQWPFATLQALSEKDFETYYPTQVMETGWDILFFWVARMIMFGLYKTGKVPFEKVYLHGLVRDKERQKMSKSKGNVIDPLGVIDTYGNDALRMALVVGNLPGNDLPLAEDKVRGYRNFANKIWNVARFVMQNTEDYNPSRPPLKLKGGGRRPEGLSSEDKAILKDLEKISASITKLLEKQDLAHAAENLYHYFWHNFADKIIEGSKAKLADPAKRASAQLMLQTVLETNLKLLHPFMPFVTEAIWQMDHKNLLMIEKWPKK